MARLRILKPQILQNNNHRFSLRFEENTSSEKHIDFFISPQNSDLFRNDSYYEGRFLNSYAINFDIFDCEHGVNFNRQFTTILVILNRIAA
jgi:hypothetical protein